MLIFKITSPYPFADISVDISPNDIKNIFLKSMQKGLGRQADRQANLRVGRLCHQKSSINESTTTKQYQNDQIATSSLWTSCLQQTDGDKQM